MNKERRDFLKLAFTSVVVSAFSRPRTRKVPIVYTPMATAMSGGPSGFVDHGHISYSEYNEITGANTKRIREDVEKFMRSRRES